VSVFSIAVRSDSGQQIVVLGGEVDLAAVAPLRRCLATLPPGDLVIDLGDVTFMDCSALGCLVGAQNARRRSGRKVRICHAPPRIATFVETAGLGSLLADAVSR